MFSTKWVCHVSLLVVAYITPGCIMVRGGELQLPVKWTPDKPAERKTITLLVKDRSGSDRASTDAAQRAMHIIEGQAQKAYTDSALFTHVSVTAEPADLVADIEVMEDGSKALAGISGFICGYTLGIIPGYAHVTITLNTVFRDNSGTERGNIRKSESVSLWMQLFLLAAMPFRDDLKVVEREIYYDLNRATLEEARIKASL